MNTSTLYRYGTQLNSHDLIKAIAIILVIIDHTAEFLLENNPWCRLLGRGAAPLFFFLIGYSAKLRVRVSLVIYALILTFTGFLLFNHLWLNILVNFIFIYCFLNLFPPQLSHKWTQISLYIGAILLHPVLSKYIEYGTTGFLIAYSARLLYLQKPAGKYGLGVSLFLYYLWQGYAFGFYQRQILLTGLGLICVALYLAMVFYKFRPIACPPRLRLPLLILSRYSLEIYFYQLFTLQLIFITIIMVKFSS